MKHYWLVVLIVLMALAACGGGDEQQEADTAGQVVGLPEDARSEEAVAEPVQVRIGIGGGPDSLNPGMAQLALTNNILRLVYDSLYELQLDGTYSLVLAEDVRVSPDGAVWTFTLRDGVTFHDGERLTAEDVVYSYNLYMTQEGFSGLSAFAEQLAAAEALDEHTVVVTLSEALPDSESIFSNLYILPEHIWSQVDDTTEFENLEMIGSGPFRLSDYRQDEFLSLVAVKEHYLNSPKIDGAVFQVFDNPDALVQALRAEQVDMIVELPNTAVSSLRDETNIEVINGVALEPFVTDLAINMITEENCPPEVGVCSGHPALQDRDVRLALAHATDKRQIIAVVMLGLASPGVTLIPDGLGDFFNDEIDDHTFDIELANQILDEAGYLDNDGDGIREMPGGGDSLIFQLNWPAGGEEGARSARIADMLAASWEQIGVGTTLAALDVEALLGLCCPAYEHDLFIWGWSTTPNPGFLLSVMTTDQIGGALSLNETGYSNPDYDRLFAEQATELDRNARIAIVHEMQQIVHRDLPYIVLYYPDIVQAYRSDRFKGWQTDAVNVLLEHRASLTNIEPVE